MYYVGMGTSPFTHEFIVRQNVSTYTSQLFKFLKVHLLLSKNIYYCVFVIQVRPPVNYLPNTYLFEPPLFKTDLQTKNHAHPWMENL